MKGIVTYIYFGVSASFLEVAYYGLDDEVLNVAANYSLIMQPNELIWSTSLVIGMVLKNNEKIILIKQDY